MFNLYYIRQNKETRKERKKIDRAIQIPIRIRIRLKNSSHSIKQFFPMQFVYLKIR